MRFALSHIAEQLNSPRVLRNAYYSEVRSGTSRETTETVDESGGRCSEAEFSKLEKRACMAGHLRGRFIGTWEEDGGYTVIPV